MQPSDPTYDVRNPSLAVFCLKFIGSLPYVFFFFLMCVGVFCWCFPLDHFRFKGVLEVLLKASKQRMVKPGWCSLSDFSPA